MKCPDRQADNPESAKFCISCGQSLQAEITFPNCAENSPAGKHHPSRSIDDAAAWCYPQALRKKLPDNLF
jgi:hypothetical protein